MTYNDVTASNRVNLVDPIVVTLESSRYLHYWNENTIELHDWGDDDNCIFLGV